MQEEKLKSDLYLQQVDKIWVLNPQLFCNKL